MAHIATTTVAVGAVWQVHPMLAGGRSLAHLELIEPRTHRQLVALLLTLEEAADLLEAARQAMDAVRRGDDHPALRPVDD